MADLFILEGVDDDFGWGEGVKNNRPHLMDYEVKVFGRKNPLPHLIDMTPDEIDAGRRQVPIVQPFIERVMRSRGLRPMVTSSITPLPYSKVRTPPQRGIPYYTPHLPLGYLPMSKRRFGK